MQSSQNTSALPWYKHRWPWFLMLGPGTVVVAGCFTAWLAWHGQDGMVVDDYYKEGKAINRQIARDSQAQTWGLEAVLTLDVNNAQGIQIALRANTTSYTPPAGLRLLLIHPTQPQADLKIALQHAADHSWRGQLPATLDLKQVTARRTLILEDTENRWRLLGEWLPGMQTIRLQPAL